MLLLNPNVSWYARLKSYFRQKYPVQTKNLEEFWNSQSGDWHWLTEKTIPNYGILLFTGFQQSTNIIRSTG